MSWRGAGVWAGIVFVAGALVIGATVVSSPRPEALSPAGVVAVAAEGAVSEEPTIIRTPQLDSATPTAPPTGSTSTPGPVVSESEPGPGRAIAFGAAAFAVMVAAIILWWWIGDRRRRGGASPEHR